MSESDETATPTAPPQPGCFPAILASTVLMGIIGFVTCGVTTWLLYGKRTEMAIRTLEGSLIPAIEQSRLRPEEKTAIVGQLEQVTLEFKRGQLENWQTAAVMQRLARIPLLQWGELHVIEAFLESAADDDPAGPVAQALGERGIETVEAATRQITRIRRAIEIGQVTTFDLEDVLKPVLVADGSPEGRSLQDPLEAAAVAEMISRAKTVADRSEVPDQRFENVRLERIIDRQIDAGLASG